MRPDTSYSERWIVAIKGFPAHLWLRLRGYLDQRAETGKDEWAASIEYKRRYTNPDEAKRHRGPPI